MSATFQNNIFGSTNVASVAASSFVNGSGQAIAGPNFSSANFLSLNGDPQNGYTLSSSNQASGPFTQIDTLTTSTLGVPIVRDNPDQIILNSNSSSRSYIFSNTPITPGQTFNFTATQGDFAYNAQTAPCFRKGTLITTMSGPVPVELLRVNEPILTASGAFKPVKWIGSRTVDCSRHPQPERVWPVRIRAGAFGSSLPGRDLWLSPDHAIFAEGVLIPAQELVNGDAVVQVPVDEVSYWHVELECHDVIMAEGLPCESYLDTANRSAFENGPGPIALHPDFGALSWELACAPLCIVGPEVERVRATLGETPGLEQAA